MAIGIPSGGSIIPKISGNMISSASEVSGVDKEQKTAFGEIFDAAMGVVKETNSLQKVADQKSLDFALGKSDNIHEVMMAQEQASIALQFTVQLRNSLLDAYNEIMRMQI